MANGESELTPLNYKNRFVKVSIFELPNAISVYTSIHENVKIGGVVQSVSLGGTMITQDSKVEKFQQSSHMSSSKINYTLSCARTVK